MTDRALDVPVLIAHGIPLKVVMEPGRMLEFRPLFDPDFGYKMALKFVDSPDIQELTSDQAFRLIKGLSFATSQESREFVAHLAVLKDAVAKKNMMWELAGRPRYPVAKI